MHEARSCRAVNPSVCACWDFKDIPTLAQGGAGVIAVPVVNQVKIACIAPSILTGFSVSPSKCVTGVTEPVFSSSHRKLMPVGWQRATAP